MCMADATKPGHLLNDGRRVSDNNRVESVPALHVQRERPISLMDGQVSCRMPELKYTYHAAAKTDIVVLEVPPC